MSNLSLNTQLPKVGADFHGQPSTTRSPDAPLFDDGASVRPDSGEFDIRPANVERLFSVVNPDIRLDSAQPTHFADVVLGLRKKPQVKHVITYDEGDKYYPVVQTHDGQVLLPQILENSRRVAISCINTQSGELKSLNVEKEGYVPKLFLKHGSAATRQGVSFAWIATKGGDGVPRLMMTYVDAALQNIQWTREISDKPTDGVSFIHETATGDLALLCGASYQNARLLILDKDTGAAIHEFSFPAEDNNHFGDPSRPYIFFNDAAKRTAVFGLYVSDSYSAQLYSIDFSTFEVNKIDSREIYLSTSVFVQLSNGNALVLRQPGSLAACSSQRVTFSDNHTFQMTPFEVDASVDSTEPLVLNRNQKFAVTHHSDDISFFSISDTKIELLERVPLPLEVAGVSPDDRTAMTADDVVYHSRSVRNETGQITYRLYAFDAATREELWQTEHMFESPPAVVVNVDGSITWVSRKTAVILNN